MPTEIELLEQLVDSSQANSALWVAAIAAGSAVLGSAVTAIYGYVTTKRTLDSAERTERFRIHTGIVTSERLRWLADLRERFASFQQQIDMQYNLLRRPIPAGKAEDVQAKIDDFSMTVMEQGNMIHLMLNQNKTNQRELQIVIQSQLSTIINACKDRNSGSFEFDDDGYTDLKTAAFNRMASIGIETWKQIKDKD